MFYSMRILRTSSPGDRILSNPEITAPGNYQLEMQLNGRGLTLGSSFMIIIDSLSETISTIKLNAFIYIFSIKI